MVSLFFRMFQKILYFLRTVTVCLCGGTECAVCGGFSHIMPVCSVCASTVYSVENILAKRRCSVCGKPLVSEEEKCMECRDGGVYLHTDTVTPLFEYRLWNKEILFIWKILGVRSLSPFFAEKMAYVLRHCSAECIVPVPPRKGKIAQKGWDQIEELCQFFEHIYGFTVLRILERNSGTVEQKKLGRQGRLETIGKSFVLVPENKMKKQLKKNGGRLPDQVWLIDDILTTGSTAESCAKVLKEGGIKKVNVMALFTAA